MESASRAYQRYAAQDISNDVLSVIYRKVQGHEKADFMQEFEDVFLPTDLKILCDLLDQG